LIVGFLRNTGTLDTRTDVIALEKRYVETLSSLSRAARLYTFFCYDPRPVTRYSMHYAQCIRTLKCPKSTALEGCWGSHSFLSTLELENLVALVPELLAQKQYFSSRDL
jgi:hypothetical protein